ncbi:hypothetical protein D9613_010352 [Agrocybe pediades]|uniref:F-box domain-containing protein n=1 Tax=Agrocybe pediades TaxID=84607 RepID=A0A8H4VHZ2_9AGAR|nr:hypothetical protein D9613_010352 [Agrocybe pediades]
MLPPYQVGQPPISLLHSSFIPTSTDEDNVRKVVQGVERELESLDEEITRMKLALARLEERRADLHSTLLKHRSVLAPIRRLPPEILGIIFSFAIEGCTVRYPARRDSMPWVLGQVCSFWREVQISLPQLWSLLDVELFFFNHLGDDASFAAGLHEAQEFVETCLRRSGKELLNLSLRGIGTGSTAAMKVVLRLFVEHAERWRDAYLEFDVYDFLPTLSPAMHRLPNLSSLSLFSYQRPEQLPVIAPFEDAPKLTTLAISGIHNPFYTLIVPWSQISHLTSKSSTFQQGEFTQLLRATQALAYLHTESERILEAASSQPVSLPHLTKLSVVNKGTYIANVFQFLDIPNVRDLRIHATTRLASSVTVGRIIRSGCAPTHLSFTSSLLPDTHVEDNMAIIILLTYLPSITHLELTVVYSFTEIMPKLFLTRSSGPTTFLPALQSIHLNDKICVSEERIFEALASRIEKCDEESYGAWPENQQGLKEIMLRLSSPPRPTFPQLEKLRAAATQYGVGITIEAA